MSESLVDQYCPQAHGAAITAAARDAASGATITADANGTVAITRPNERYPSLIFDMDGPVHGAVAVVSGGSLVGVGDDAGTVCVYNTWDGSCVFEDIKEGPAGPARAFRALAFNPEGTMLAALSVDGIIRVYDIQRWERVANYQGFSGESLQFDARGERLLAIDNLGQPKLLDLMTHEQVDLEKVPGGVRVARFTPDADSIVCMGQAGVSIIDPVSGHIETSFSARGASGMHGIVIAPDGGQLAAVTGRSIHFFQLPDLQPVDSAKHGADEPTGAAMWDDRGVLVAGTDGVFHRPGAARSLPPVVCAAGFGEHRVAVHGQTLAIWHKNRMKRPFRADRDLVEVRIDRDGRLIAGVGPDTPVAVYDARTGRHLFDADPDTTDSPKVEVGGPVVAVQLKSGGLRWFDLKENSILELPWVQGFALSGSGTWIAAITPNGEVRVLDPATGKDAVPPPQPMADVPVTLVSFVNRRPDMLVLDEEGVLGVYDLTEAVTGQKSVPCREILDFNVDVDRLWGITGGQFAAIRFQEPEDDTATVVFCDLHKREVVSEVPGLLPYAWVDAETGSILQPARGGAILEMDMYGKESRVLRALPEGEWIAFGEDAVYDKSANAM